VPRSTSGDAGHHDRRGTAGNDGPGREELSEAATAFGLLASPMRLQIMWLLIAAESDVGGLAERLDASMPAVSQHLAKLKLAGMVRSRREGRRQVYLVDDPVLVDVVRLMLNRRTAAETRPSLARRNVGS
jgi:DNA-binding transcriptional ArsR family regulator